MIWVEVERESTSRIMRVTGRSTWTTLVSTRTLDGVSLVLDPVKLVNSSALPLRWAIPDITIKM